MKKNIIILVLILVASVHTQGQYSQLQLGDTTKSAYPYKFPILGAAAYDQGFDLPLPVGIMVNYFYANQGILIPDVAVGFSDGILPTIPLTDLTRIIDFEYVKSTVNSINIRPDLWIFPFLNIYGIFGKSYATTEVKLSYPVEFVSLTKMEGTSFGFGTTGAFGVGKYFIVADGNWVWSNMSNFEDPVKSKVLSARIGRAFKFSNNPEQNVALWVGGMRIRMGGITQGTIFLGDLFPPDADQVKNDLVEDYWAWYEEIDPVKQQLANKLLNPIADNLIEADGSGTVEYKITKEPVMEWNIIVGGQFQLNKAIQLRTELGIVGDRKSLLLSANYRFGI